MTAEILSPTSPCWPEFIERLHYAIMISSDPPLEWLCSGDHCHARSIMARMGDVDIESSLALLAQQACPCDCSVLDRFYPWDDFGRPHRRR
jgi:hypothetical protein